MNDKTLAWVTLVVSLATLAIVAKFAYEAKAAQNRVAEAKSLLGFG